MAFSAYKRQTDVQDKLGLRFSWQDFLPEVLAQAVPSSWLIEYLSESYSFNTGSEKARSEFLIAPILIDAVRPYKDRFSVVSGPTLDAPDALSKAQGLFGALDFAVCREKDTRELQCPIVVVVEAKKGDLELGYWQCAAEMLAARRLNDKQGKSTPTVYGCVSVGEFWRFLQLYENTLTVEQRIHTLTNLPDLLGAWHAILNAAKAE